MKHKEGIEVKNLDIRRAVSGNGLKYKDVAKAMGITPEHLSRLLRFTLSQGNKLRTALDQFLSHYTSPHFVLECEQQSIICRAAQDGRGVGLLSPVTLYTHNDQPNDPKDPFYTFPVKNNIQPYVTWLYCYEGQLYEQYTSAGHDFEPQSGSAICPAQSFEPKISDGLLTVDMTDGAGQPCTVCVGLRCAR